MKTSTLDLSNVFRSLPAAILILDTNMVVLAATDNFYKFTLTKPETLLGKNLFDAFPENDNTAEAKGARKIRASIEQVILNKQTHILPVQRYDLKLPTGKSGEFTTRWWRITNSPVLNISGELIYVINAVEDITSMVDKLEEAQLAIIRKQKKT